MVKGVARAALLAVLAGKVRAWWDSGHYLSACVARDYLIIKGRQDVVDKANKLMALYDTNGVTNDMCRASCWMDWIKEYQNRAGQHQMEVFDAITGFNNLHYIDFITNSSHQMPTELDITNYLANSTLVNLHALLNNAIYLTPNPGTPHLADNYGTVYAQSLMMRWLLHLMADAHQPMHMTAMHVYVDEWTCVLNGSVIAGPFDGTDAGGNGIYVQMAADVDPELAAAGATNLHQLWDSMGGYGTLWADEIDDQEMFDKAHALYLNYPPNEAMLDGFVLTTPNLIRDIYTPTAYMAARGLDQLNSSIYASFGSRYAYDNINIPEFYCPYEITNKNCCKKFEVTKEDGQWVMDMSKKLVALAGYRIADYLERWFDGLSPRLIEEIDNEYDHQTSPECPDGTPPPTCPPTVCPPPTPPPTCPPPVCPPPTPPPECPPPECPPPECPPPECPNPSGAGLAITSAAAGVVLAGIAMA